MASRSSADKLKPLPPDPDRQQHSAIPPTERPSTGAKASCSGLHCVGIGELLWPEPSRCSTTTLTQSEPRCTSACQTMSSAAALTNGPTRHYRAGLRVVALLSASTTHPPLNSIRTVLTDYWTGTRAGLIVFLRSSHAGTGKFLDLRKAGLNSLDW